MDKKQTKRVSQILNNLRLKRDNQDYQRTRTSMLLAACILEAIKNKGWTKGKFAEEINKKPSVITKWLSGIHNFTSDTISDIQQVLGIQLLKLETEGATSIQSGNTATMNLTVNFFNPITDYSEIIEGETVLLESIEAIPGVQVTKTVPAVFN